MCSVKAMKTYTHTQPRNVPILPFPWTCTNSHKNKNSHRHANRKDTFFDLDCKHPEVVIRTFHLSFLWPYLSGICQIWFSYPDHPSLSSPSVNSERRSNDNYSYHLIKRMGNIRTVSEWHNNTLAMQDYKKSCTGVAKFENPIVISTFI